MENTNIAKIVNITNYEELSSEKRMKDNDLANSIEYVKPELQDDYKDTLMAYEGNSYYTYAVVMAARCIAKLGMNYPVDFVYSDISKSLPFVKGKIVYFVEKFSLRGKEFGEYVASLSKENAIPFPTSKTTSRR